jgi:hypothetical protein
MNKLLVTCTLLALSTLAAADAPTPPPLPSPPPGRAMPVPQCTKTGGVLFEEKLQLELRPEMNAVAEPTWTITVYDGGAWERHDLDGNGRNPQASSGCLSRDQVSTIRTALAKATWTVSHAEVTCAAISNTFTSYSSKGKQLWAAHMCQIDFLDPVSDKALGTISMLLEKVTAPHLPPCCKSTNVQK